MAGQATADELAVQESDMIFKIPRELVSDVKDRMIRSLINNLFMNERALVENITWDFDKGPINPNDPNSDIGFRLYSKDAEELILKHQKQYLEDHPSSEATIKFEKYTNDMSRGDNWSLMQVNNSNSKTKAMYNEILDRAMADPEWKKLKCPISTKAEEPVSKEEQKYIKEEFDKINEWGMKNEKNYIPFEWNAVRVPGTDLIDLSIIGKDALDVSKTIQAYNAALTKESKETGIGLEDGMIKLKNKNLLVVNMDELKKNQHRNRDRVDEGPKGRG